MWRNVRRTHGLQRRLRRFAHAHAPFEAARRQHCLDNRGWRERRRIRIELQPASRARRVLAFVPFLPTGVGRGLWAKTREGAVNCVTNAGVGSSNTSSLE